MAAIDKLLEAMDRYGADEARLESGQAPCLLLANGTRPLKVKKLSTAQIAGLLAEVAPKEMHEEVQSGPAAEFQYVPPAPPRPVALSMSRTNGSMTVAVRWAAPSPMPPPGVPLSPMEAGDAPELDIPDEEAETLDAAIPDIAPVQVNGSSVPGDHVIDELFRIVVERGASDLHLSTGNPPFLRLHGEMVPIEDRPEYTAEVLEKVLFEITPEKNLEQYKKIRDTDFAYPFGDICRFRCNLFMDHKGPGGVFRQIPNEILSPEQIGLPKKVLELCFLSKGLVVVTGPTGSGKSTTLATMVDYINRHRRDHIITMEDPIEFVHRNKKCVVHQREVGVHTESFKNALRAALREDPDICLVGEMRDLETVAMAIETAETGHLVFGTLHTNTAASTVDRIIDQFPADRQGQIRVMLSETLKGVIAQTLCRKTGGGRVAAFEVLFGIQSISNLIREGKTYQIESILQTGRQYGMVTMNQSLLELVLSRKVEPAQAYLKSVDQQDMLAHFKRANIPFDPSKQGESL